MIVGFHAEYYIILHSDSIDAGQAIFEPPPEKWKQPMGRLHTTWMKNIHDDLPSLDLGIYEAGGLVQNWPLLMSLHSAMHVWWCMLLLDRVVGKLVVRDQKSFPKESGCGWGKVDASQWFNHIWISASTWMGDRKIPEPGLKTRKSPNQNVGWLEVQWVNWYLVCEWTKNLSCVILSEGLVTTWHWMCINWMNYDVGPA